MAQLNSLQYANYVLTPQLKNPSRDWGGRSRNWYASFVANQGGVTTAAGDCVRMFRIPAGHRVVRGQLTWTALGSSTALWCGDFWDCDRYLMQVTTSAASNLQGSPAGNSSCGHFNNVSTTWNSSTNSPDTGIGYLQTCDTDVLLTFSYAGTPTGIVTLSMETVVEG